MTFYLDGPGGRLESRVPSLAPTNRLKREVQSVLTKDFADADNAVGHGSFDGFAYVATEAYFRLAGGHAAGLNPMSVTRYGRTHWWLVDSDGRVIDLTLSPDETSDFPYELGRYRSFRYAPGLSRQTRTIVARVLANRG